MLKNNIFFFLFLFSLHNIYSQGTWTWMHGSNANNVAGNFGVQGVAAATNTPPALYEACEWTDLQGNFWLFGGADGNAGRFSALWKFDPVTNMWTWMKGPSTANQNAVYGVKGVPALANNPAAVDVGMLSWVDVQGNLWMTGGQSIAGFMSDLWKYDIATNMWTWMHGPGTGGNVGSYGVKGVAAATNLPPARAETAAAWTDNNNNLWFFGGLNHNDLWKFDIGANMWTWMKGSNGFGSQGLFGVKGVPSSITEPPARDPYARWKDLQGNFWMLGGQRWALANDLWKYDPVTNEWTWVRGDSIPGLAVPAANLCGKLSTDDPSNRWENRACWVDTCGNFWMFGGGTSSTTFSNEMWHYNVQSNVWTKVNAQSATSSGTILVPSPTNKPAARFGALPFTDLNGNLWLFGGWESFVAGKRNDLWKYVIDTACAGGCGLPSTVVTANFTSSTLSGCASLNVNFTNTSSNSTNWTWTFGDGNSSSQQNPSNTYANPGTYTVTLIATDGTTNDTTTQTINVYANAVAAYTASNDTLCTNQSVTFTNTSTNSNASNWNFGNGNTSTLTSPSTSYPTAGNYTVTLIAQNANGCHDTLTMPITVVPSFTQNQAASICTGQTYTLPGGTVVNTSGLYKDTLTSINGCDSIINTTLTVSAFVTSSQNPILCQGNSFTLPSGIPVNTAGVYIDTIPSSGGCDSVITTTVIVNQHSSSNQSNSICNGNSFTLPDGTVVTTAGTYIDTVPNSKGCDSIITITLNVNPNPTASVNASGSTTLLLGQSTTLTASGGGTYSWTPTIGLNPTTGNSVTAKPFFTTTYCVIVTDTNGCTDSACVKIIVTEIPCPANDNLAVPNAFSPNGDNVNDDFCLQGWDVCIENFSIFIFDRWGEKVFESKDPNFCWDGIYKGAPMDASVFVYYINAKFKNIESKIVKRGNISLIR